jgi:hypothetical protein
MVVVHLVIIRKGRQAVEGETNTDGSVKYIWCGFKIRSQFFIGSAHVDIQYAAGQAEIGNLIGLA